MATPEAAYSLVNLLSDGSFENGGWVGTGVVDTTHVKYGTKSLKITGISNADEVLTYSTETPTLTQGHIYYCRYEVYHTGATGMMGMYWPEAEPYFFENQSLGIANKWNTVSSINTRANWSTMTSKVRIDYDNLKATTSIWVDGMLLIDLTACLGSFASSVNKEWCDNNIPFFLGTYSLDGSKLPKTYDLTSSTPTDLKAGDIINCPYSGSYKTINLPAGTYKLECWGAEGGYRSSTSYSGKGGYSYGTLTLLEPQTAYVYAGGAGNTAPGSNSVKVGGFNGGGYRYLYNGGGGGSDIRIRANTYLGRLIVAGGGGSDGATNKKGMYGGGISGGAATENFGSYGYGGSQTGHTTTVSSLPTTQPTTNSSSNYKGGFGFGGFGYYTSSGYGGAGGGGWYGGCGSVPDSSGDDDRGGGGGSGYVYTSSTKSSYPTGCALTTDDYLTDAATVAGNTAFTSPSGTNETGHSGNGYCRITVLNIKKTFNAKTKIDGAWKNISKIYVKVGGVWKEASSIKIKINGTWK